MVSRLIAADEAGVVPERLWCDVCGVTVYSGADETESEAVCVSEFDGAEESYGVPGRAFASAYGRRAKADDDTVVQFGQTVIPTYQAQLTAIGWQTGSSQEAAVKAVADKIAPIMADIEAKFVAQRAAAQAKIDLSQLPPEECDGETAKIGHKVGIGNNAEPAAKPHS